MTKNDGIAAIGFALIVAGTWMIYAPAALILAGVLAVGVASVAAATGDR